MSQDILIVESDRHLARYLGGFLEEKGYRISYAESRGEGLRLAEEQQPDIILLDLQLPDGDGLELLQSLSRHVPGVSIIVMTASGSIADSVKAMKLGAMDYLLKPIDREAVATLLTHGGQGPDRTAPRPGIPEQIIGRSPPMKRLFYLLDQIIRAEKEGLCPAILIQGETGTGKELVAKAIHQRSPRARFPFVEINCPAIPDSLLEAELFGYERGSFTDARSTKKGLFEVADRGVLFLDEIGYLKLDMQVKLLKVIEEKVVRRLGSTQAKQVDVQVIAATNTPLDLAVREGKFREDLFFRLSVITLTLPPLRERGEDILLLAEHFLDRYTRPRGLPKIVISPEAQKLLLSYPWPGNVRELQHVIERAILLERPTRLEPQHLQLHPTLCPSPPPSPFPSNNGHTDHKVKIEFPAEGIPLEEVEKSLIQQALLRSMGNQSEAARLLGLTRNTLRYRMEKYGLVG